jgi:hypothetical protein
MLAALVIVLSALINRMAGGGWPVGLLEGTPARWLCGRVQTAAYLGLVALMLHEWQIALAFAFGFLFWRLFGWGHLISLGRPSGAMNREPTGVDRVLIEIAGPHLGLVLRMLFVLPCLVAVNLLGGWPYAVFLAVPFAFLAMLAYEFWWCVRTDPIREAELTVGALWGALIVLA